MSLTIIDHPARAFPDDNDIIAENAEKADLPAGIVRGWLPMCRGKREQLTMRLVHIFAGIAGGVVGAALVVAVVYWGAEGNDALAFSGSIIGAAVTAGSIIAAWKLGTHQIEIQRYTAEWSALSDFNKKMTVDLPGLMASRNFMIYIRGDLNDPHMDQKDLISLIAVRRFANHHSTIMANVANAVDTFLPEAPNDIRSKISGILIDCDFASRAATLRAAKLAAKEAAQSEEEVAGLLTNVQIKAEGLLNEILTRIEEVEKLDDLTKKRRAELLARLSTPQGPTRV